MSESPAREEADAAAADALPSPGRFEAGRLIVIAFLAVGAMFMECLAVAGTESDGFGLATRATARTSFALFSMAFVASSARRLWPSRFTRWLLRNRRYLGLSFAVSHGFHLLAIVMLARADPAAFEAETPLVTLVFGGFGFVVVAALAATSSDPAVRLLGARHWSQLHRFGVWYLWAIFTITTLPVAPPAPLYWLYPIVAFGSVGIRIAARRARRAPAQAAT